jgi:hypothetical protein
MHASGVRVLGAPGLRLTPILGLPQIGLLSFVGPTIHQEATLMSCPKPEGGAMPPFLRLLPHSGW